MIAYSVPEALSATLRIFAKAPPPSTGSFLSNSKVPFQIDGNVILGSLGAGGILADLADRVSFLGEKQEAAVVVDVVFAGTVVLADAAAKTGDADTKSLDVAGFAGLIGPCVRKRCRPHCLGPGGGTDTLDLDPDAITAYCLYGSEAMALVGPASDTFALFAVLVVAVVLALPDTLHRASRYTTLAC